MSVEFYLPKTNSRQLRLQDLLNADERIALVNHLQAWLQTLHVIQEQVMEAEAPTLTALIAACYQQPPATPLAKAVTATTRLSLVIKFGSAGDIPHVGDASQQSVTAAAESILELVAAAEQRPEPGAPQVYWVLQAARLFPGVISRLQQSENLIVRQCLQVVQTQTKVQGTSIRVAPQQPLSELSPLADRLQSWLLAPARNWTPADFAEVVRPWTLCALDKFGWPRWQTSELFCYWLSGDVRQLGWRGGWRLAVALLALTMTIVGYTVAGHARRQQDAFRNEHLVVPLRNLQGK